MSTLLSDDVPEFGEELVGSGSRLRRPWASCFLLLSRSSALLLYLLCERLHVELTLTFVVTTLLLSADFWTVKNVSGRLLVGLRWWNLVDEEGNSRWLFESRQSAGIASRREASVFEQRLFWISLFACPLLWLLLTLSSLLGFHYVYIVLPILGLVLSSANLYGFLRCRFGTSGGLLGPVGSRLTFSILRQQAWSRVGALFSRPHSNSTQQTV